MKHFAWPAAALALSATPALAHLNPEEHGSFMAGLSHPVFGADHILAMVAVGIWAASRGGKLLWQLPGAFVGSMVLGFILALLGAPLPFVEPMILASVLVLGLLVATAARIPASACIAICAAFGLFHGHAHGGELGSAGAVTFGIGFAVATAALHGGGVCTAIVARRWFQSPAVVRALGALTAVGGAWLAFG